MSRRLLSSKSLQICSGASSLNLGLRQTFINKVNRNSIPLGRKHEIRSQSTTQTRGYSTTGRGSVPWLRVQSSPCQISIGHKRGLASEAQKFFLLVRPRDDDTLYIGNRNEKPLVLDRHWLRDSCQCSLCVNPDSGQKNFGTCDIPTELPIKTIKTTKEGGLRVVWEDDFLSGNHVSEYTANQIDASEPEYVLPGITLWDKDLFERDRLTIDYNDWIAGEHGFFSGLHRLHTHGLIFIRNVPSSEESVISIANKIGNLQETFYGRTWDVRSKPNAENVAYTNAFLGLHQDLMYMQDPPRLQLLHCLENTCEGGESMFSDGFRASHLMDLGPPMLFEYLLNKKVRYQYKKNGHHYQLSRPVIARLSKFKHEIAWSPPFQSSYQRIAKTASGSQNYREWLEAATIFRTLLEDKHWMYQYKMQPGECVIFDNLRVLHGRRQFNSGSGSRWLKGAYIANDVYKSKLATSSKRLLELDVGNQLALLYQVSKFNIKYKIWDGTDDEMLNRRIINRMSQVGVEIGGRTYTEANGATIEYY
ncbi:Clavaminate synthase-like protein [Daldinia vernicosa]|uniref:Clavaminate synthase-like protein n=1 Tax=Daldinia vernicosa TaxID=114800 RepID=UPI002008909C|nr:Clavaminate synthase-like protein [Daldinia vernicosa]KAI0849095.1 Clavaminate synthase-like protein [Daldinia vernicosa]